MVNSFIEKRWKVESKLTVFQQLKDYILLYSTDAVDTIYRINLQASSGGAMVLGARGKGIFGAPPL